MSEEYEIKRLLRGAVEKLLNRTLTEQEVEKLYNLYQSEYGTDYRRAIEAIMSFSALTENQLNQKRASSDDLDRVLQDLVNRLDGK